MKQELLIDRKELLTRALTGALVVEYIYASAGAKIAAKRWNSLLQFDHDHTNDIINELREVSTVLQLMRRHWASERWR